MDKLSSFTRFKASCPFLGRTKTSTLRTLSTSSSARFPSLSGLTERATKCPVMGPALTARSKELVAGYASFAGKAEVDKIHKEQGVSVPAGATIEMCPHATAARAAARMAEDLTAAANLKAKQDAAKKAKADVSAAAAAGCPFHQQASAAKPKVAAPGTFDYEAFYVNELDKKHKDASYRYFNNINRLAAKFPVAHTGEVKDEVEVWCANDYLGMGNNPIVLETMQYVRIEMPFIETNSDPSAGPWINTATERVGLAILPATVLCILALSKKSRHCTASLLPSSFHHATSLTMLHSRLLVLSFLAAFSSPTL